MEASDASENGRVKTFKNSPLHKNNEKIGNNGQNQLFQKAVN